MRFIRWFQFVNLAGAVAPLRGAPRKAPRRKPAQPTFWPELLEDRTLLSAGALQPALLVDSGKDSPAPAAYKGQPTEAGPGPAPARSTSQGDEGAGGLPHAGPTDSGPAGDGGNGRQARSSGVVPDNDEAVGSLRDGDQQGSPADGGSTGDGGNGRQARSSGAVPDNDETVGRLRAGHQEGGQQGVASVAFSSDEAASAGRFSLLAAFGGGATPGAHATAEVVPFASAVPAESPEAIAAAADALFASAPVEASLVGLPANASSTDVAGALVGSELGAQLSRAGSAANAGPALLLNAELFLSGASRPSDFWQFLAGDGAFLELWDRDQLLFPDSLPKVDELQFPGGLPWEQDMPLPDRTPNLGGPLSLGERQVEVLILASAVGEAAESAPALPNGQETVAEPALAASPGSGLALSSPDANRPEASPADPTGAPVDRLDTDRGGDPLRPYKIALGLLPFLPAFGFTAVTLREQVLAGLRRWQELRDWRRRGR
jgi:hypothetical protein